MLDYICNSALVCASVIVLALFLRRPKAGALAYLAAVLIVPFGHIGTWTPHIEQVLIAPMLLIRAAAYQEDRRRLAVSKWLLLFVAWLLWIAVGGIVSDWALDWQGLGGETRLLCIAIVFSSIRWSEEDLRRAHVVFVALAVPIGLLTVAQTLGLTWARSLTEAAYTSWTSSVFKTQVALEVAGSGFRGVGSFGNPAGAGTYFALVLSVGVLLLSGRSLATKVPKLVLASGVALSIIGGIASQSGTFLAASATMLVAVVIFVRRSSRIKLFWHTLLWSALLVASIGLALQRTEMISRNLTFQIDSFLAGSRLDSRYVRKDSSILAAWQDALEHPIAGVGAVKKDYYSLNDSLYVSVLTPSGFLGAPLFFVPVLAIAWKAWRARGSGEYALLWTAAMLTTGIGTVAMFAPRIGDWWWAVQGMFLSVTLTHFPRPTRVGRRVLRASGDGLSPKLVLAPAPRWHDGVV